MIKLIKPYHGVYLVDVDDGPLFLIDGGRKGTGRYTIVPYIKRILKRNYVDAIINTHFHDNHTGGGVDVLERMPVNKFISTGVYSTGEGLGRPEDLEDQQRLDNVLNATNTPHEWITENNVKNDGVPHLINESGDFRIEAIGRYPNNPAGIPDDGLSHLILRIIYGDLVILHPTDITSSGQWTDLNNLKAQILIMGHHGDTRGFTDGFVDPIEPGLCIIGNYASDDSTRSFFTDKGIESWYYNVEGKPLLEGQKDGTWNIKKAPTPTISRIPTN